MSNRKYRPCFQVRSAAGWPGSLHTPLPVCHPMGDATDKFSLAIETVKRLIADKEQVVSLLTDILGLLDRMRP